MTAYTPDIVAQAFIDEGKRRNVSPVGIQECICAGLDESGLRVLANPADPQSMSLPNDGLGTDHDSDGPLQQRGSQGWGTLQCRMDPSCSAGLFYDRLVRLPTGYTNLAAHTAGWYIQQVQRSFDATGNNYQAQWPHAIAIYNRLAGDAPGIPQAWVDLAISIFVARIGDSYVFGGAYSSTNVRQGTDCSGMADTILQALTHGPGMQWGRHVSTESWPYNYPQDLAVAVGTIGPYGTICAGDAQPGGVHSQIPSDAAAVIYILHGGGGADSHMMINVNDGHGGWILMETGGAHNDTGGLGKYASPHGPATPTNSAEWTDIWYLPGPIGGGAQDMDADQDRLLREMHGSLFNPISSQSPFRALGEGAIWQQHQMPINDDGMSHPQYVEWAAERGSRSDLALLETLAAGNPLAYSDRADDITLAKTTLARVRAVLSGQTPPNVVGPVPPPNVTFTDTTDSTPPAPASSGITTAKLLSWGKDAVTILGVIGTWATSVHDILGQYLAGSASVTVPSVLAAAALLTGSSTVHEKNVAKREVTRMKSVAPQRRD